MMGEYGVYSIAILLAVASATVGRPTEVTDKGEFHASRREIELLRPVRPCHARRLEVRTDIAEFGDIRGDPHYVPDCDEEGILWKSAQCDHHDVGRCFCVHENDGTVKNDTITLRLNKEALKCGRRIEYNSHVDHICLHMRSEFDHMQKEFGLQGLSPLPYLPECTEKGKFVPMQRDGSSNFFCVDTETGAIIPDTMTTAGSLPPLNVYICEAYDKIWQNFKVWNATEEKSFEKTVTEDSCKKGFTFTECGCPKICTSESQADDEAECACKPACLCPAGKWELEGECVSLEECHEANPKSNVIFAEKVDALSAGKFSKWKQYQLMNPNAVLETYNAMGGPMEAPVGESAVASDVDPNAVSFFYEGAPPPEEGQEENETSEMNNDNGTFRGAERIPITGERVPVHRQVLTKGDLTPEDIEDIVETGTRRGPTTLPPEEMETTEFDPFAESFDEELENEEDETGDYELEETTAEPELSVTMEAEEEYIATVASTDYERMEEANETDTETEEYKWFSEMEETFPTEQTTDYETTEENRRELEPEYPIEPTLPPEELWVPSETPNNRIEIPPEEGLNTQGISPGEEEPNNPEPRDEALGRQKKLTSVPNAPNDEQQEHSSTPPCEEVENQHETETAKPPTTTKEGKSLIDRVLQKNKVFVNLRRESPTIKKSICG